MRSRRCVLTGPIVSLVVYPEIHLFGGSDLATDANELAG